MLFNECVFLLNNQSYSELRVSTCFDLKEEGYGFLYVLVDRLPERIRCIKQDCKRKWHREEIGSDHAVCFMLSIESCSLPTSSLL